MAEAILCPECGKTVPADAPQGLCPACMMQAGLPSDIAEQGTIAAAAPSTQEAATLPPQTPARPGDETAAPPVAEFVTEPASSGSNETLVSIPGYKILGELGRGGMGVVYKAKHIKLSRLVALKMILAGGHAGEADLARFRTEAEAIARLQHLNIVQVHEISEHDGKPYFSLEFCTGGSLAQKINGTPWNARDAASMIETLAHAMEAAHKKGVIHRDLKPANVLLLEDGTPKITDFGLAKKLDEAGQTQSGAIMGTPSYMAPEQAGGKKDIGPATDVYALGAILYELLTGRPPFLAATVMDTVMQVVSDDPVPLRQLQSKTPRDLETICLKCLQKEPGKRYVSAEALAEDLRRFQAGEPILARPSTIGERGLKWAKRRPAVAGLLAVSGLSALGLLVVAGVFWRDAEQRAQTVQDLAQARGDVKVQQELVGKKRAEVERLEKVTEKEQTAAQTARDTARLVLFAADMQFAHAAWERNNIARVLTMLNRHRPKAGQPDLRGFEWYYLQRLCHQDRLTLTAPAADGPISEFALTFTPIAISPDGTTLAEATSEKKIRWYDLATGKQVGLAALPDFAFMLAFAADGKTLQAAMYNPNAIKPDNAGKVAKANPQDDILVMMGKAKPTLQKFLRNYQIQSFTRDGRQVGALQQAEPSRHLPSSGRAVGLTFGPIHLKGEIFQGTCGIASADRKALAIAGVSTTLNFKNPLAASPQNAVLFWDLTKGEPHKVIKGLNDVVKAMAFAPDGKTLALAEGKVVRLWEVPSGKERLVLKGHAVALGAVAFSHDGKLVAAGSLDGSIKVWNAETGDELNTLRGHRTQVTSLVFTPDGKTLASVSADGTIKLWDPLAPQGPLHLKLDKNIVHLAFESDSQTLIAMTERGAQTKWDVTTAREKSRSPGATTLAAGIWASRDGKTLAIQKSGPNVRLLDVATSQERPELKGHKAPVKFAAFSPDGQVVATTSVDKTVRLWDVGTGAERCTLPVDALCLAFSSDGKTLATGTVGKTVALWDTATGKPRPFHAKHPNRISHLSFSADGALLAAAGTDTVVVWSVATGHEAFVIRNAGNVFRAIAFSNDGKRLATVSSRAGMPADVSLWDTISGQEVLSLVMTSATSNSMLQLPDNHVAFSPDGTRLAVSERIWEALRVRSEITIWSATPVAEKISHAGAKSER